MSEWLERKLVDVVILQRGFDLPEPQREPGSYPVIASTGIVGSHAQAMVHGPGVVIGRSGSLGGGQFTQSDFWPLNTTLWVKDFKGNDPRYCYYLLRSLDLAKFNVGSGVPTLNRNYIHPLPVVVPKDLDEQRAISHILGTLDDKIGLNQQMNDTLEAISEALFRSWFVNLDPVRAKVKGQDSNLPKRIEVLFPSSFEESDFGEVPAGWSFQSIAELSEKVAMGPFGSSIKVSTFIPSGIPVISGQHLHHTMLEDNEYNFVSPEHAERLRNSNVFRGDIIFTHAGNIGQVAYIPETSRYERYVISQRQFYMRCNLTKTSPFFIVYYFKSPEGQHKLLANTSSTGVPSLAQPVSYLKTIKLRVPPKPLIDEFDKIVRSLHLRMSNNNQESNTLAGIRDTLLPKLISGKLRIAPQKILGDVAK